jgi:predicted kinase
MSQFDSTSSTPHTINIEGNRFVYTPPGPKAEDVMQKRDVFSLWESQTSFLLGKVLTVVDASYSDREQRKAVKDLVRQQFREQTKWVCSITTGANLLVAEGEEMKPV